MKRGYFGFLNLGLVALVITVSRTVTVADPHQIRWFADEISANSVNTANDYADPKLEVSFDDTYIIVDSNGIPNFEFVSTTPNGLAAQNFKWEIPRFPEPASQPAQIPLLGTVAVTVTVCVPSSVLVVEDGTTFNTDVAVFSVTHVGNEPIPVTAAVSVIVAPCHCEAFVVKSTSASVFVLWNERLL